MAEGKKETLAFFASELAAKRAELHRACNSTGKDQATRVQAALEAANEAFATYKAAVDKKTAALQKAVELL